MPITPLDLVQSCQHLNMIPPSPSRRTVGWHSGGELEIIRCYSKIAILGRHVIAPWLDLPGLEASWAITLKVQLGSYTALAIGAFATTLTALSLALMGFRGVSVTNAFIGNFFGVARVGMVVMAQWEIVLGNTYAYTILSAFGLFTPDLDSFITPFFGVAASYEGGVDGVQYSNALGFFLLSELFLPTPSCNF